MSQLHRSRSSSQLQQKTPLTEAQKPAVAQMVPLHRHAEECVGGGASSGQGDEGDSHCSPDAEDHALRCTPKFQLLTFASSHLKRSSCRLLMNCPIAQFDTCSVASVLQ